MTRKAYVKQSLHTLLKIFATFVFTFLFTWGLAHVYVKFYGGVWPDFNIWEFVKGEVLWILPILLGAGGLTGFLEIFRKGGRK